MLRIASVAGVAAPAAPAGSLASPDVVLPADTANPVAITVEASNIPVGTTVTVRVSGQYGVPTSASATLSGTPESSSATVNLAIPTNQASVITASVSFTLTAGAGHTPIFVDGEPVERVVVVAGVGSESSATYYSRSGRVLVSSRIR